MTAPAQYPELPEAYDGMPSQKGKGILDGFTADQMRAYVDAAREQDRARAGKAQAASHTAPERIYLDIGDQFDLERVLEGGLSWQSLEGVTWSEDNATGYGIEYVRADRTRAAAPPPAVGVSEPVATVYKMEALVPGGSVKCHAQMHKAVPAGTKLYALDTGKDLGALAREGE